MARLTTLILSGSKRSAMGAPQPQRPSEPVPWPLRTVESPMRMSDGRSGLAGPLRPRPFSWVRASGGVRAGGGVDGVGAVVVVGMGSLRADDVGAACCGGDGQQGDEAGDGGGEEGGVSEGTSRRIGPSSEVV